MIHNYEVMTTEQLRKEEVRLVDLADYVLVLMKPYQDNKRRQIQLEDIEDRIALVRFMITGDIQP